MAAAIRRGPAGNPGMGQQSRPMLPEHIARKLNARYGKSAMVDANGAAMREDSEFSESMNDSRAARMARRRQQRSAERTSSLVIEDSREGPPAFHGLGLRDDYTNPQRMWQEQMVQNRQRQMELQNDAAGAASFGAAPSREREEEAQPAESSRRCKAFCSCWHKCPKGGVAPQGDRSRRRCTALNPLPSARGIFCTARLVG